MAGPFYVKSIARCLWEPAGKTQARALRETSPDVHDPALSNRQVGNSTILE